MLVEVAIAWRWRLRNGDQPISDGMCRYARLAYGYWVVAFISGGLLVGLARRAARTALLFTPVVGALPALSRDP